MTAFNLAPVVAAVNTKALWYLTRGSGIVALLLVTAAVVGGIITTKRWSSPTLSRFVVEWLHRNISLLAVVFLAVHISTAIIDGFTPIGWLDAVVPFRSPYRPIWLGLGAVAFDLVIAVVATSLLRVRLGYRLWKAIHWTAYACWPIAVVHGLGTGSDTRQAWALALDAAAATAVLASVTWRVASSRPTRSGARLAAMSVGVMIPVLVVIWLSAGPLRPGWSRAAQTAVPLLTRPTSDVATISSRTVSAGGATTTQPTPLAAPFAAQLTGMATRQDGASGLTTIDIRADLNTVPPLAVEVILQGTARQGGGVTLDRGSVTLARTDSSQQYRGPVASLRNGQIGAIVADAAGNRLDLDIQITIDQATNKVSGTLRAGSATRTGAP